MNNLPDTELFSNICTGKDLNEFIQILYRDHFHSLASYVMKNHGNIQDAEDVFQDVIIHFIRVLQKGTFREESGIGTFLYSINRHLWLNELKRRERSLLREERYTRELASSEPDPPDHTDQKKIRKHVEELLGHTGEICRRLLTLYYYENLTIREIKPYFEYTSEKVVRKKLCNCQKQLVLILKGKPLLRKRLKSLLRQEKTGSFV